MRWLRWIPASLLLISVCWAAALYLGVAFSAHPADRPVKAFQFGSPLRISFVGTSLTASYDWPVHLNDCADRSISVSRIARAGAASDWGRRQADGIVANHPDVIFIEFSVNDADLRHRISLRESASNHRTLIRHLRARLPEARIVLMTMSPAHGIRRILRPRLPAYYRLYRDLAEELDTGLLDIYPRWLAVPKPAREQQDGLHPSQTTASRIILPALGSYLGLTCQSETPAS